MPALPSVLKAISLSLAMTLALTSTTPTPEKSAAVNAPRNTTSAKLLTAASRSKTSFVKPQRTSKTTSIPASTAVQLAPTSLIVVYLLTPASVASAADTADTSAPTAPAVGPHVREGLTHS